MGFGSKGGVIYRSTVVDRRKDKYFKQSEERRGWPKPRDKNELTGAVHWQGSNSVMVSSIAS
jgi:hypothetical protein